MALAALAAIAVGITTAGSIASHKREAAAEAELERFKLETESRIADSRARAVEAELKLAEFRKGRSIGLEESEKIVAALKPFAGTKFDIGHAPVGREQWDFLWQLEPVFPKAGWAFVDWNGPQTFSKLNWTMTPHTYGVANVLNVDIEMTPDHRKNLLPAAEALAKVLNEIGIATAVMDTPIGSTSTNADAIHVLVGEKR